MSLAAPWQKNGQKRRGKKNKNHYSNVVTKRTSARTVQQKYESRGRPGLNEATVTWTSYVYNEKSVAGISPKCCVHRAHAIIGRGNSAGNAAVIIGFRSYSKC